MVVSLYLLAVQRCVELFLLACFCRSKFLSGLLFLLLMQNHFSNLLSQKPGCRKRGRSGWTIKKKTNKKIKIKMKKSALPQAQASRDQLLAPRFSSPMYLFPEIEIQYR